MICSTTTHCLWAMFPTALESASSFRIAFPSLPRTSGKTIVQFQKDEALAFHVVGFLLSSTSILARLGGLRAHPQSHCHRIWKIAAQKYNTTAQSNDLSSLLQLFPGVEQVVFSNKRTGSLENEGNYMPHHVVK